MIAWKVEICHLGRMERGENVNWIIEQPLEITKRGYRAGVTLMLVAPCRAGCCGKLLFLSEHKGI